jgi:UDP-glucose 4-epimerase
MLVLVTGGAGFIGSHTVEALLNDGQNVRVLDNLSSGNINNLPESNSKLEIVIGDVLDSKAVESCMNGVTHVLHLAAQVSVPQSIKDPIKSHLINVDGYLNVLEIARKNNVLRVIHASSAAVYGNPNNSLPLTEKSSTITCSPYGLQKLIMDQYAALYVDLFGVSTLGMRYFNVYGPRQDPKSTYSGVISRFTKSALEDELVTIFGNGSQTRDFIYVKDVARANISALYSKISGVVNIATGESNNLLELIGILNANLSTPVTICHKTAREGDIEVSTVLPNRMREELHILDTVKLADGLSELLLHLKCNDYEGSNK